MYIGAMAGGAVGTIVHRFAPFATGGPGAYALVGMGTLFAGIIRAPMTSVFMIFEITQDYQILVPLMVAHLLSFVISRRYQPAPVYHALLHQDDVHLPSPTTQASRSSRTARHVMTTDVWLIPPEMSAAAAWDWAAHHQAPVYLVGTRDHFVGMVRRDRLEARGTGADAHDTIGAAVDDRFVHGHPDHSLDVVLERLAESGGILPIVSRAAIHRLEGIATRETILGPAAARSPREAPAER